MKKFLLNYSTAYSAMILNDEILLRLFSVNFLEEPSLAEVTLKALDKSTLSGIPIEKSFPLLLRI